MRILARYRDSSLELFGLEATEMSFPKESWGAGLEHETDAGVGKRAGPTSLMAHCTAGESEASQKDFT